MAISNDTVLSDEMDDVIFGSFSKKWDDAINSLSRLLDIPVAIIFRREQDNIRVVVTNQNEKNPFKKDDSIPIKGSFCNYVFEHNAKFKVPDYRKIDLDINNVATQADFISYLGFPLNWPNGELFGTICLLDDTTNYYSGATEDFLKNFSEMLNDSLHLIDLTYKVRRESDALRQEVEDTEMRTTTDFNPMCRICQQVRYNDTWINLNEFLAEHPEELIKSMPPDWCLHQCTN